MTHDFDSRSSIDVPAALSRVLRYAWASPATAIGLLAALPAACTGAQLRFRDGVVEVCGGVLGRLPASLPFVAMTLGHVVLARDDATADACRAHERVHVRQYERFGPLFVPLYLASSAWQSLRGRRPYWDNPFERQARDESASPPLRSAR